MSPTTAELDARLELLEEAFFGPEVAEDVCDDTDCLCHHSETTDGTTVTAEALAGVVLDGAESAIERLTEIAEGGTDTEALEASNLLLQYGLALVDRGRV